jgi:hypothetical protein
MLRDNEVHSAERKTFATTAKMVSNRYTLICQLTTPLGRKKMFTASSVRGNGELLDATAARISGGNYKHYRSVILKPQRILAIANYLQRIV